MNTDFRVSTACMGHPKIVKLRRRLGADAVLSLFALWAWTAQERPSGCLHGMDAEDIAIAAGYPEDPKTFVDTLVTLRLMDRDEDGTLSIHDWEDHQPDAERNALRNKSPLPYDWNRRRYSVFIRDDFTCRYCGTKVEKPHCDHVIPRSKGGKDAVENLVTACPSCNLRKSDRTPEEWMS